MTDKTLAEAIAKGDKEASHMFIEKHYSGVYRFLSHTLQRPEDTEDLTQQTFVAAITSIKSYRGEASLKTWLYKISVRELLGWRRKLKLAVLLRDDHAVDEGTAGRIENGQILLDALRLIPERQRVAFLLFEVQQFSIAEVAQIMNIPQGTVKSHLHYARNSLRSHLENTEEKNYNETNIIEN